MKRPLVVKLGSSLVVDERGRPRRSLLRARAAEIAAIVESGTPTCIVSSGAIALGLRRLDLAGRPTSLPRLQAVLDRLGIEVREPERVGHEWANDPDRIASVTVRSVESLDAAVALANEETSGLAAAIVTEDADAAARFLDAYRGTTAFWNATTRFTDGFALTGSPETGINVDRVPGPRGPVTYRDLYLRQYRVVGDGTQAR